jgi:hypothetical protein
MLILFFKVIADFVLQRKLTTRRMLLIWRILQAILNQSGKCRAFLP